MARQVAEEAAGEHGRMISPQVAQVLSELTWTYAETLGSDLALFAKHAKRSGVTVDDVILAVRKSPTLVEAMRETLRVRPFIVWEPLRPS